jgi:2-polyprenyl-3-methyl-5-hydroxy-6-metoxy-1,4-benzoquinol methylase
MKDDCVSVANMPCWCGSATHQECWRTARFGLLRCPSCSCYRIDPPPLADEGAGEAFYTKYYEQPRKPARAPTKNRASRFWDVAAADPCLLEPGASALDLGCGEGQLCDELLRCGWRAVVGVDVSRTRIQRARQRYPTVQFYDVPLRHTDVAPETFDLVVMDNVLEHLPDPLECLRELRTYLTPRGRLVLITPNMESGNYRLLRRRWTPELAPHAQFFCPRVQP